MNIRKTVACLFIAPSLFVCYCKVSRPAAFQRDATGKIIVNPHPNPAYLTAKESMQAISLPPGYHLELVASEPMIKEPVAIVWDGNAAMYVAEMRTYMQDVDGTGENRPVCQVARLEDTNGDGKMDKRTTFIDSLVLPRMLLCLGHKLLVNETYTYNIFSYEDRNGDGKADEKNLVYKNDKPDTRNLEHQKSGLLWNIDNWIYVSCDPVRYRYVDGKLQADSLANSPGGQWGVANDDYGRLYFSSAGAEIPALGFQLNPSYGLLNPRDQFDDEFQAVWPIIATPDVQGGMGRLRPDTTLNHFTANCGQSVYRGDALPADLRGDLLICEPVGRLIRRAKVLQEGGKVVLKNAYNQQEFIASADMNFRPVNTATGPDGCLYIVDMHRGIIQESNWTKEGSFLRPRILEKGLDKNIGQGRIYRLVHDGFKRGPAPHLLNESAAQLLTYLDHPNAWWRENAQRELIVRADHSVVPALREIAAGNHPRIGQKTGTLARLHALWTLDGLNAMDKALLFASLQDGDARVRQAAVWISERYLKQNDAQTIGKLAALQNDPSADVQVQLLSSLSYCKSADAQPLVTRLVASSSYKPLLQTVANSIEVNKNTFLFGGRLASMTAARRGLILDGEGIYKQLCTTCHGPDGKGLLIGGNAAAPPLASSQRVAGSKENLVRILLNGLSGPIDGKSYSDVMAPFGAANKDEWVAAVLSYIRYNFVRENRRFEPVVTADEVKRLRLETAGREKLWTLEELAKEDKQQQ
ncbi:MAG: c-type cytochrome [Williamsia sp.]|nr:c-type cytochrome [Williamsia sp.]